MTPQRASGRAVAGAGGRDGLDVEEVVRIAVARRSRAAGKGWGELWHPKTSIGDDTAVSLAFQHWLGKDVREEGLGLATTGNARPQDVSDYHRGYGVVSRSEGVASLRQIG